jgi:hypothetical protein
MITRADQCSEANHYTGQETREHVILSAYKFQAQMKKWRKDCPFCRFDIICHSLGGAVVVYWAAVVGDVEDLAYVHNIITIDSPINGIFSFEIKFDPLDIRGSFLREQAVLFKQGLDKSAGVAGRALRGQRIEGGPIVISADQFLDNLKKVPRADLTCIGNDQEALILPVEATRETCLSYQGAYSSPWWKNSDFQAGIGNAHGQPLEHSTVLAAIDLALVRNDARWIQSAARRTEPLADRDARIRELSTFPIVEPGATTTLTITMANLGVLPWSVEDDALELVGGEPFGQLKRMRLTVPVPQSRATPFILTFKAPPAPGVYTNEWQMTYKGQPYGSRVLFTVVVLTEEQRNPGGLISAFIGKVWEDTQAQIAQLGRKAREQVERLVRAEIERQINRLIGGLCGAGPAAVMIASAITWRRRRRRGEHDRES